MLVQSADYFSKTEVFSSFKMRDYCRVCFANDFAIRVD